MELDQTHIHLIGNSEDSFYTLGKRDKTSFNDIYSQISGLCARNNALAKVIKITTELANNFSHKKKPANFKELQAYAEGLEKPVEDLLFSMLLPEIVASFNKWVPNLMGVIPGCSSLFVQDPQNGGVVHTRILDYALSGPFEKNERSVLYDFHNELKVFSLSTAGMPLPSMSAMNEKGLTMALHYKHGDYFDQTGDSIFCLTAELIKNCTTIREAIKFLRKRKSISYWGIYLSDASGEVASIDICGTEIYQEKYDIADYPYLYFNNRHLLKHRNFENLQPYGNINQCQMRKISFEKNLGKTKLKEEKDIMLASIKALGAKKETKKSHARDWKLAPVTPSSIQLISLHNKLGLAASVPGDGPKFFKGKLKRFESVFERTKINLEESKNTSSKYSSAYESLAKYQSAIDMADTSLAYHEIQMAILKFKGSPEEIISSFYFLITQYLCENDKRDLSYLYIGFQELENKLPPYLEDHRKLFILRLAKITGLKVVDQSQEIKNKSLRELYLKELKLNNFALRGLKNFIFPRIEILDIIYAY